MNLERIQEETYNTYLHFRDFSDNVGVGLAYDYDMLREQILENHGRVISFNSSMMLYYTYIDNKHKLTCRTKEGLEDKLVNFYMKNFTGLYHFPAVFDRALIFNKKYDYLAPSSIDRYKCDFYKYLDNSPYFNQDIRCITEKDIIKFFNEIMKDKPTSKNVSNIKTVIKMVFSYARMQEQVECLHINSVFNNMQFPQRAFAPKKIQQNRVFNDDHLDKVFNYLSDDNVIDLGIKLTFYTGLRVGELCALKVEDIDIPGKVLTVNRAETVSGTGDNRTYEDAAPKCYKCREVVLSTKAVDVLNKLIVLCRSGFLFPDGESHKHKHVFDRRLRRICDTLHLPAFSMHDIRRTYASKLLDSDVTERFVQDQMGHTDIRTTRQYYYYSTQRQNEYQRMADISAI